MSKSSWLIACLMLSSSVDGQNIDYEALAREAIGQARKTVQEPVVQRQADHLRKQTIENPAWRALIEERRQSVGSEMFGLSEDEISPATEPTGARFYVFVSSSMGIDSVNHYAAQASKIPGAVLVMRGFIGGAKKTKPTMQFIGSSLKKDRNCQGWDCPQWPIGMQIDPLAFQRFGVERVPAFAIEPNPFVEGYCEAEPDELQHDPTRHVLYGSVSVEWAVDWLLTRHPGISL
ncbi:MAG: type-F conjugative transfer system pilin assembly protein TrbC [Gammaproteobacteria bacterium]